MKKDKEKLPEVIKLDPKDYWEWRTSIAEMQIAEKDLKASQLQHGLILKDIEITQLKSAIFRNSLSTFEDKKNLAKKEYEALKKSIEEKLKISLNGCVIDDVTYEVKKLED